MRDNKFQQYKFFIKFYQIFLPRKYKLLIEQLVTTLYKERMLYGYITFVQNAILKKYCNLYFVLLVCISSCLRDLQTMFQLKKSSSKHLRTS